MSKTYISVSLRRMVFDRASRTCEYCLIPEAFTFSSHQVDHVIAEKHGGETIAENLALSCALCNQSKGSDISSIDPDTGEIEKLYNPRRDQWTEHFQVTVESGMIYPTTPIGRVTVRLLQMNRVENLVGRQLLLQVGILVIPRERSGEEEKGKN